MPFTGIGGDPASCQFAVHVAAAYSGTGLGRALTSTLIDAAKARGLTELDGFALRVKQLMLRLAARLGFTKASDVGDHQPEHCGKSRHPTGTAANPTRSIWRGAPD